MIPIERAIHYELLPLFEVLFCETNPIPVKAAAAALGWCSDEIRLPLTRLTDANRERLTVVLKDTPEMEAMALGACRVLAGQEQPKRYQESQ